MSSEKTLLLHVYVARKEHNKMEKTLITYLLTKIQDELAASYLKLDNDSVKFIDKLNTNIQAQEDDFGLKQEKQPKPEKNPENWDFAFFVLSNGFSYAEASSIVCDSDFFTQKIGNIVFFQILNDVCAHHPHLECSFNIRWRYIRKSGNAQHKYNKDMEDELVEDDILQGILCRLGQAKDRHWTHQCP